MTRAHTRSGMSLIELLVVLAIITFLSTLGLMVWPGIRDQDKVRDTASKVGGALKTAQGMAAKDKAARGVRFVVGLDPTNPAKSAPGPGTRYVTELQFVELPPPMIPNPKPLSPSALNPAATFNPDFEPRVRFLYATAPQPSKAGDPPAGTILSRQCFIENLTQAQANQVEAGCTLVMSVFGTWHKIIGVVPVSPAQAAPLPSWAKDTGGGRFSGEVQLEVFPDAVMGGGTHALIHHFAIYLRAVPLVGLKPVLLPDGVCVDLNTPGSPAQGTNTDFDVVFGPDGKLVGAGSGQLFLWVRNYTKPPVYDPATGMFLTGTPLVDAFRRGGDQYILSVRNSGAHGHAPALWPVMGSGMYSAGQDAYTLARQELQQE